MQRNGNLQESAGWLPKPRSPLPNVTWHGVWVKLVGTAFYGRVAFIDTQLHVSLNPGGYCYEIEVITYVQVVWENDAGPKGKSKTSGSHDPVDLIVLPAKPSPWYLYERNLQRRTDALLQEYQDAPKPSRRAS